MLQFLLDLGPLHTSAVVLACLSIFFLSRKLVVDYKIRKLGGVRAPVLATNPVTGEVLIIQLDKYCC
jgi:hypothetical protein